jgi:hypothetical protein
MLPERCARQDVIAGAALRKRLRLIEVTSLDCLRGSRETMARSWALLHRSAQRTERTAHTLGVGLRCARQGTSRSDKN